jgi:hypothetical protein
MAQARNNLITEQTNLADSETNFLSAVGQMPDQLERPAPFMAMLPANLDEARQQMLENSPILRSAESDIAAAEKQYEAAKSTFYPRFDAELGRTADNDLDGQNGHNNEWQAMLRMRFNLYSGGSNKADLESKSYLANQALDIRNNALRQLNEELGLAWNALNNANAQVPIAQQYVDHSTACAPPTSAVQPRRAHTARFARQRKRVVHRFAPSGRNQEHSVIYSVSNQGDHGRVAQEPGSGRTDGIRRAERCEAEGPTARDELSSLHCSIVSQECRAWNQKSVEFNSAMIRAAARRSVAGWSARSVHAAPETRQPRRC